ncbi:MAG: glycosyltransferase family 4 protein [Nitrospinota bacterium]
MDPPIPIVYTAAHGGYHPERRPLGGGAAVCWRLVHHWAADPQISLTLLTPEKKPPDFPRTVRYVHLPVLDDDVHPARLTLLEYARFSRRFEAAATDYVQALTKQSPFRRFAVLSNDISEGVDFRRVSAMDCPVVTVFHVDVADFFSRMYLRFKGPPVASVQFHRAIADMGLSQPCPEVFRLVFEKQLECVRHSSRLVVPSEEMARTLARCYGEAATRKTAVLPWGGWDDFCSEREVETEMAKARREFDLRPETVVLLTLSRISPEKGIDRLLKALLLWEKKAPPEPIGSAAKPADLQVLICGSAAFMRGEAYAGKLRRLASRLRRIRVSFPGHVGGARKRALFRLADLYVFPSRHESYGLTLVEALRQGVPVLSSATYGARHLVRPSYGRVVDLDSRDGHRRLLAALQETLADRRGLTSMKQEALRAGRAMDFSKTASDLKDLIAATLA